MSTAWQFNLEAGVRRRINHDVNSVLINMRSGIKNTLDEINKKLKRPIKPQYILFKDLDFEEEETKKSDVNITFKIHKRANGSTNPSEHFGKVTQPMSAGDHHVLMKGTTVRMKIYTKSEGLLMNMMELVEDVLSLYPEQINPENPNMLIEGKNVESEDKQFVVFQFDITFSSYYRFAEFERPVWLAQCVEDFTQNLLD